MCQTTCDAMSKVDGHVTKESKSYRYVEHVVKMLEWTGPGALLIGNCSLCIVGYCRLHRLVPPPYRGVCLHRNVPT